MLTTADASTQLKCSRRTVRRWCIDETAAGRPLGSKHGRDWLLTEADIKRLAELVQRGPGRPSTKDER